MSITRADRAPRGTICLASPGIRSGSPERTALDQQFTPALYLLYAAHARPLVVRPGRDRCNHTARFQAPVALLKTLMQGDRGPDSNSSATPCSVPDFLSGMSAFWSMISYAGPRSMVTTAPCNSSSGIAVISDLFATLIAPARRAVNSTQIIWIGPCLAARSKRTPNLPPPPRALRSKPLHPDALLRVQPRTFPSWSCDGTPCANGNKRRELALASATSAMRMRTGLVRTFACWRVSSSAKLPKMSGSSDSPPE